MCQKCAYLSQLRTVIAAQLCILCLEQPWEHSNNFSRYLRVWFFYWLFLWCLEEGFLMWGSGECMDCCRGWAISQFLFCQNGQALVKAAQRVSILGDTQNLSRHSSIWPCFEQRVWSRQSEEVLHQQFCDSIKFPTTAIPKRATAPWSALWSRGLHLSLLPRRENIWWSWYNIWGSWENIWWTKYHNTTPGTVEDCSLS